jgi:Domain of unknown function (DUF4160)
MGRLHRIGKISIRVYANDHLPPHFHVIAPDAEGLVEISTLAILRGEIPVHARRRILAWAAAHQAEIVDEWNRINPRFPIA